MASAQGARVGLVLVLDRRFSLLRAAGLRVGTGGIRVGPIYVLAELADVSVLFGGAQLPELCVGQHHERFVGHRRIECSAALTEWVCGFVTVCDRL